MAHKKYLFSTVGKVKAKKARRFDNLSILQTNNQEKDVIDQIDEEYGKTNYGSVRNTQNEMFWMGYIYRFFAYTYDLSSRQVYKIIKPKELRGLYLPYHTMDPGQAVERILEAKGLDMDNKYSIERQYKIYRRIRESS